MPLDYASVAPGSHRIAPRFCLVAFGGGGVGFLLWCAVDWVLVRFLPAHIHDFGWVALLFPFAAGFAGFAILRNPDAPLRAGLAIFAAMVASTVAVVLILTFSLWFHLAIGGRL